MTQHRTDGTPTADAAAAYLGALGDRMRADGCGVTSTRWEGHRVLVGTRSDRKARWFGTKCELFVLAAAVPEVDRASLIEFTQWAMAFARSCRSGVPGARNAAMVLPALVAGRVQLSATAWASADGRVLGTTTIGRPVVVEALPSGAARVTVYRGRAAFGGMFTGHVLEKAALYFPDQRPR